MVVKMRKQQSSACVSRFKIMTGNKRTNIEWTDATDCNSFPADAVGYKNILAAYIRQSLTTTELLPV